MSIIKKYNSTNFFKYTFCEFKQVDDFNFPENNNYKSKSESTYFYADEGVYRKSNHWGRVANCRWKLISNNNYKNQQTVVGFAKWSNFYPLNSSQKLFFIKVDFDKSSVKIKSEKRDSNKHLFSFNEAQKKVKKINYLLKNDRWVTYFNGDKEFIKQKIITLYINSNKKLQEIKADFL
ncbi:hypothetical protein [Polaribacter porphyrae]|uniref:Uncharacterized protein n=1 Tax=Polaribacter porphyrae TaxID=1137780 RepID=A0A2S7WM01_9FLAO|nr:hypothetical protein [Polaribacter porphyrae]PQJ78630.1 hypothetical protein BTO18_05260 [Polaribacter porphyrae]